MECKIISSDAFTYLLAPMLQLKSLPLSFLAESGLPKEDGFPGKYLAGVLHALIQAAGQEKATEIWRAGKISLESFVPKDQITDFVASNVRNVCLTDLKKISYRPSVTASFYYHVLKQRHMGHKLNLRNLLIFCFEFAILAF